MKCPWCHSERVDYRDRSNDGLHYFGCVDCDNYWPEKVSKLCPECGEPSTRNDTDLCTPCLFRDLPF